MVLPTGCKEVSLGSTSTTALAQCGSSPPTIAATLIKTTVSTSQRHQTAVSTGHRCSPPRTTPAVPKTPHNVNSNAVMRPQSPAGRWRVCAASSWRLPVRQSRRVDRRWRQRWQSSGMAHAAGDNVQSERQRRPLANIPVPKQQRHSMAAAERRRAAALPAASP
jgi:hypothetical protein